MHITARQEQFSHSAVFAIASRAGCAVSLRNVDDDSIDLTLCSRQFSRRPSVDVQLKCTSQDILEPAELKFVLSRKNYDDLRENDLLVPRILLVFLVPLDIEEWLEQTEDEMLIRKCGYWRSLRGVPETTNSSGITISVPRISTFSVPSLTAMMQNIHDGVEL